MFVVGDKWDIIWGAIFGGIMGWFASMVTLIVVIKLAERRLGRNNEQEVGREYK